MSQRVVADLGQSNFGQSIFGHRVWPANFGQSIVGQSIFCVVVLWLVLVWVGVLCCLFLICLCCCVLCVAVCCCVLFCVVAVCCSVLFCVVLLLCVWWVCSGPLRRTPSAGPPKFRSFFPSPATVFILFSLSCWSFSLNFGGVFEDRDPQMCTFGLSGCRVKPRRPHQTGPPGLAHDSPRTPNVHISGHRRFKHHQNSTKKTKRDGKRIKNCGGRGKKSAKFWAPTVRAPTLRAPTLRGPTTSGPHFFWVCPLSPWGDPPRGPHPSGAPPFGGPTLRGSTLRGSTLRGSHFFFVWPPTLRGPTMTQKYYPKNWIGQNWIGQNWIGQNWIGQNWPGQNHDGQKKIGQNWIGQNWSNQDGQNGIGQSRSLPSQSRKLRISNRMAHQRNGAPAPSQGAGVSHNDPRKHKRALLVGCGLEPRPQFPGERHQITKFAAKNMKKSDILGDPAEEGPAKDGPPEEGLAEVVQWREVRRRGVQRKEGQEAQKSHHTKNTHNRAPAHHSTGAGYRFPFTPQIGVCDLRCSHE